MLLRKLSIPVKFNNFSASPTEVAQKKKRTLFSQKEKRTSGKTSPYKDQREGINNQTLKLFP